MEDILLGITSLKLELDAIDEDLQLHIRKTRDIESEILRTSEQVKILADEEESCLAAVTLQEGRFQCLEILSGQSQKYLLQARSTFSGAEDAVKQITCKVKKDREEFMSFCSLFQREVESFTSERQSVLSNKNTFCEQIAKLNSLIAAAEVSGQSIFQEKKQYCEQLSCENKDLHALLQENIIKHDKIIEEIESHNNTMRELHAINSQMSGELHGNEDAIRQLKDLVMGLQIQLSNLLDQN